MVFHWSLRDSKSPQVSRTLLSILAIPTNEVVWLVSTRPFITKSSRSFNNPSVILPKAPITIFISTCLMVSASKMPKNLQISFSPGVLILSLFASSIPSVRCRLLLFLTNMAHYLPVPFRPSDVVCCCSLQTWHIICQFHSVRQMSSAAVPYKHGTFFNAEFCPNVLTAYSHSVYLSFLFLLIFCKQFEVVHVH